MLSHCEEKRIKKEMGAFYIDLQDRLYLNKIFICFLFLTIVV